MYLSTSFKGKMLKGKKWKAEMWPKIRVFESGMLPGL